MLTARQLIGGLVVMFLLAVIYMGIPKIPECGEFSYQVMRSGSGELYFILDQENAKKLSDLISALSEGRCRLPG